MRPILTTSANSAALLAESRHQLVQFGHQLLVQQEDGNVQRGGVSVVRGLRAVDVIVRVTEFVLPLLVAHQLECTVGDDFVGRHVGRCAGAALDHIDCELIVQLAVH